MTSGGLNTSNAWLGGADLAWRIKDQDEIPDETALEEYRQQAIKCLAESQIEPAFKATLDLVLASPAVPVPMDAAKAAIAAEAADPNRPFSERLKSALQVIPLSKLCKRAFAALSEERRPLPLYQLSGGVRFGQATLKYLEPGESIGSLAKADDKRLVWKAGARFSLFSPNPSFPPSWKRLTFEAAVLTEQKYEEDDDNIRWCFDRDPVVTEGMSSSSSESCDELPAAAPTRTRSLRAEAAIGYVSSNSLARSSVSIFAELGDSSPNNLYSFGFQFPAYLQYTSANYSGLVRVNPSISRTRDSNGNKDWSVQLTIALLGQRNLFQTALE